jgi:hypothetical protein
MHIINKNLSRNKSNLKISCEVRAVFVMFSCKIVLFRVLDYKFHKFSKCATHL